MYNIDDSVRDYRTNPWKRALEDRIEVLRNAKRLGKKTIAMLYPVFDSSTFRYRGYNVAETLEYSFEWSAMYFEEKEIAELKAAMEYVDVLDIIRCGWDFEMGDLIDIAKKQGAKVVYDVDDLIYHPKYMPIVIKTLGLKKGIEWDSWFGLTQRNYMITEQCDAYITTNSYLGEYLEKDFQKPVYVIKNYLNWIQESVSEEILREKQNQTVEKPFIIGYFSGSPTHVKDIMIAMPEIEQFLKNHDDTMLRIVGYMELPEEYAYLKKEGRLEYIPFQTFVGLQAEQAKVDVNIVPLVNNEFSNCKSELKYFETAIVGTITCATPTHTYKTAIVDGDNGYLCEKGDWLPALEKIYAEGSSVERQNYICQRAIEQYGGKNQLEHVENVFNSIYNGK